MKYAVKQSDGKLLGPWQLSKTTNGKKEERITANNSIAMAGTLQGFSRLLPVCTDLPSLG